jgi:glycosyltransferase involved in cell wall biosynthesis
MSIDVIIPTYNRAHVLDRTVQSVLNQSYKDFRIILVDDGSTDGTNEKVHQYKNDSRFKILTQENQGVSSARNLGIRHSSNDWISFLDSDDEWLPHKLKKQMDLIQDNPHLEFVHSNEIWIRNGQRVNPKIKFDKSSRDLFQRSLELCLISPSTVLMKRQLCQKHGLFNESFPVCEDYDLWLKILATEEIGFVSDNLIMKYGGHEDQLSTKYPAMDFWRIKSMIMLLGNYELSLEFKDLVITEINKKAPVLLNGYLKHQNLEQHGILKRMLDTFFTKLA